MGEFSENLSDLYSDICEHSPEGVLVLDEEGRILHANPKSTEILGYSQDRLLNRPFTDFFSTEELGKPFGGVKGRVFSPSEYIDIPLKVGNKAVSRVDVAVSRIERNERQFYAVFIRDVTLQRRLFLDKLQSEDILSNVFEAIEDGISLLDKDFTIIRVNSWIEKRHARHMPFLGKKCFEVYQERTSVCPWCPSKRALETGKTHRAIVPYPQTGTPEGWIDLYAFPWKDKEGNIKGVVEYVKDITEQKRLQDAVVESEKRFRLFFENSAVFAYITRRDGKIVEINNAALQLLGYTREELVEGNVLTLYPYPEERERFIKKIEAQGYVKDFPIHLRRKDGEILTCLDTAVLVRTAEDSPPLYQGIIQDITEQQKLQAALVLSEKKYRNFFENSPIPAYISTLEGRFLDVNEATARLFGYTKDELLGIYLTEIYGSPEEQQRFVAALTEKGFVQDFPIRLKRRDGQTISAMITATHLEDTEGRITGFQGIIRDVTEQEKREKELSLFHILLDQIDAIVIITDTNGTIEYVNPAFERITGYSAAEARGQNPKILKSGKHDEAFYKNLWTTITSGHSWHGRFYNRRKNGTFYHEDAHIFPIRNKSGEITNFAAIKREITREVMLEEQLSQTAKLEALGKLVGSIAHDFNNILTTIQGFAELGVSKISSNVSPVNEFSEILRASKQAARIAQQLLSFSRKQVISPKPVRAGDIIRDMLPLLQRYIGEDIILETSFRAGKDIILADRGQLEQCILNLVINARDAIREKKPAPPIRKILIETQSTIVDNAYLKEHTGIAKGSYLVISVSDTGVGMDKETLKKIFDPFFTTKPHGKGTGLGCSTVFGIVKQNGGDVRAYSEPGLGTTVKIYWPLVEKDAVVEPADAETGLIPLMKGQETILVVEDDRGIREFATQALSSYGYTIYSAEDGRKALDLVEREGIQPDLLFTDVVMPKMSGRELADILSKKVKDLKVLFTSGYPEDHIAQNGFLAPHIYFLHKPYTIRDLLQKVREILDA